MKIAVSLDGVIFNRYWTRETQGDYDMDTFGSVVEGAKEGMKALRAAGHYLIIHTCRTNPELNKYRAVEDLKKNVVAALKVQDIPHDEIWTGTGKPDADLYVGENYSLFLDWDCLRDEIEDL